MEREAIIRKIKEALLALYRVDGNLIANKANEATITTQLVGYLRQAFATDRWSVDFDYNRDGHDPKRDSDGRRIRPDIIIHHRTPDRTTRHSSTNNLIAMEVKGYWNKEDRGCDTRKLLDLGRHYGYRYLFRVELGHDEGELIEIR